jgi:hypothetical protein
MGPTGNGHCERRRVAQQFRYQFNGALERRQLNQTRD